MSISIETKIKYLDFAKIMRTKLDVWNFKNYSHILLWNAYEDGESYKYSIMQPKKKAKNINEQGQVNYLVEYDKLLNKYNWIAGSLHGLP